MTKKRKSQTQTEQDEVKSEVVTYGVFFAGCVARQMVKSHQEKEIQAFFKDLGLSDKEPVDTYKDALAKY